MIGFLAKKILNKRQKIAKLEERIRMGENPDYLRIRIGRLERDIEGLEREIENAKDHLPD